MEHLWFDNWHSLLRIVVIGVCSYAALIAMLRLSGKRTLSKMSAFDMIVTIALGSTLSSVIIDKDTVLAEGLTALALLVLLQMSVSWLSMQSKTISDIVHAEPTLLLHKGRFCREAMNSVRVTQKEIEQALRHEGYTDPEGKSIVMETNGTMNVITH